MIGLSFLYARVIEIISRYFRFKDNTLLLVWKILKKDSKKGNIIVILV